MAADTYYNQQRLPYLQPSRHSMVYPPVPPQLNGQHEQSIVTTLPVSQYTNPVAHSDFAHHTPPTPAHHKLTFSEYLKSLPMFPLNTVHEAQEKQRYVNTYNECKAAYIPSSAFSTREKIIDHGISQLTGNGGLLAARHFANAITQNEAQCAKFAVREQATVVLTRWGFLPPNERQTVFVDVIEYRWKMNCTPFYVKHSANETIKLALVGKTGIKIKAGKHYWKEANFKHVDEASIDSGSGGSVPMVIIKRDQRSISGSEWKVMKERFQHGWQVPAV